MVLRRGLPGNDDGIIVRCEFCGAASQYSHGLSVFFPWSRPIGDALWDDQYSTFQFAKTGWTDFLSEYFQATMRKPQHVEEEQKEDPFPAYSLESPDLSESPDLLEAPDEDLLTLLEQVNSDVFPEEQLKAKAKDSLGLSIKSGSQDPQGSDCQCSSIKNYPPLADGSRKKGQHVSRPVANLYESYPRFLRVLKQ